MGTPFGFSIGDFIAGINLVRDVIKALKNSTGSQKEYLELIVELHSLESALLQVKALYPQVQQEAQRAVLAQAVSDCQKSIENFLQGTNKYHQHLNIGGSISKWKDALRKVQWHLCKSDELDSFRQRIVGHVASVEMLLLTVQVSSIAMTNQYLQAQQNEGQRQGGILGTVQHSIARIDKSFEDLKSQLKQQVLYQDQTMALLESAKHTMIQQQIQMLQAIQMLQSSLPAQVMLQQPVTFRDALNRVAPIHLEWINSCAAFLAVLELRFQGVGKHKVQRKEFALQRVGASKDIDLHRPWETCFCPGQQVDMSMVFTDVESMDSAVCPACKEECFGESGADVECMNCQTSFRRVANVTHEPAANTATIPPQIFPINQNPSTMKTRKRKLQSLEECGEIEDFRRVRILHQMAEPRPGSLQTQNPSPPRYTPARFMENYPTTADWERIRPVFKRLHVMENQPLRDVVSILARDFGISAPHRFYTPGHVQWGFAVDFSSEPGRKSAWYTSKVVYPTAQATT